MEIQYTKRHEYLLCVDSDGTVFHNMELKQKQCFCPVFIDVWDLHAVSRPAREVWEYVNLYSATRGANRFLALVRALELLRSRKDIPSGALHLPDLTPLKRWTETAAMLSRDSLLTALQQWPEDAGLHKALAFTDRVNASLAQTVSDIPPMAGAVVALGQLKTFCDIVVVSTAPHERLEEEWKKGGILPLATCIAGQEYGNKASCIRKAMELGGYAKERVMKIGDAPADYEAARANGVLFCPIIPGREEESWQRILRKDIGLFASGQGTDLMESYTESFFALLNAPPTWEG